MRGLFLVLEGIDGSGKSSQIAMLADYFRKGGRAVATMHFPRMGDKPYGEMVAAFLRGEYGNGVDPRLAALLFALDRLRAAPELRAALKRGDVVIADRYVHSNIAYQCAKVDDPARRERLAAWIEELEYRHHNLPRPDLALFLDAPLDFTFANLTGRRTGDDRTYLEGKRDIHEDDLDLQERVRREFVDFAERHKNEMGIVDCGDAGGGMAAPAVVNSRILDALRYYGIASR